MIDAYGMSNMELIAEIGRRLRKKRLNKNLSQKKLAAISGISRTTISDVENGKMYTVLTLIQMLRGLQSLDEFDAFIPDLGISPLQLSKLNGSARRRASKDKNSAKE